MQRSVEDGRLAKTANEAAVQFAQPAGHEVLVQFVEEVLDFVRAVRSFLQVQHTNSLQPTSVSVFSEETSHSDGRRQTATQHTLFRAMKRPAGSTNRNRLQEEVQECVVPAFSFFFEAEHEHQQEGRLRRNGGRRFK